MSTGPQHYREAEERVQYAAEVSPNLELERIHLAYAQVHATLALAAAAAPLDADVDGWTDVAGTEATP